MFEEDVEVIELEPLSEVLPIETIAVILPSSPDSKPKYFRIGSLALFSTLFF